MGEDEKGVFLGRRSGTVTSLQSFKHLSMYIVQRVQFVEYVRKKGIFLSKINFVGYKIKLTLLNVILSNIIGSYIKF
jgi:hypothetical protein